MFKTSKDVIEYLTCRTNRGYGFEHFVAFMEEVGNPQLKLNCIHVAGTNGKGSTTNYIAHMLMEAGYKVGTFTSPHLQVHQDRIRVNEQWINDEFLIACANQYYDLWQRHDCSMFEIDMFISVLYFLEHKVDFAVYEVGLGGRLDATNVIDPLISVITSIGLDHTELLGDTVEKIAAEKAGIIKKNKSCVCNEPKQSCIDVFRERCKNQDSPLYLVKDASNLHLGNPLRFDYQSIKNIELQSLATYQIGNACCAIETIIQLVNERKITISDEQIKAGILKSHWGGRFEVMSQEPLIILDGAHNEHAMKALCESMLTLPRPLIAVFSALKDKPTLQMIELLQKTCDGIIITEFDFYRAQSAQKLNESFHHQVIEDWHQAIRTGLKQATKGTLVITGSLYFISDVREALLQHEFTKKEVE